MRNIGCDTETYTIIPGRLVPNLVCATFAERVEGVFRRELYLPEQALERFRACLSNPDIRLVLHNGPFDLAVFVQYCHDTFGQEEAEAFLYDIIQAIDSGRISDTEVREKLLLNEIGILDTQGDDSSTRGIPMSDLTKKYLSIDIENTKKGVDAWRLNYHRLHNIPLELWPQEAILYAEEDACYPVLIWGMQQAAALDTYYVDERTGLIHDENRKLGKKFALHCMSAWGARTDPKKVPLLAAATQTAVDKIEALLLKEGLATKEFERGQWRVARKTRPQQDRVALAYACSALGLDVHDWLETSTNATDVDFSLLPDAWQKRKDEPVVRAIARLLCQYPDAVAIAGFESVRKNRDEHGGGLDIRVYGHPTTPSTFDPMAPSKTFPRGQVSTSRDTLTACADDVLQVLGQLGEATKLKSTYLPILWQGVERPINPRYDEMKATGRSSCKNPNMQNLPTFGMYRLKVGDSYLADDEATLVRDIADAGAWTGRRVQALLSARKDAKIDPLGGLREAFVPRDGWCLLDADIDFAECVAWSQWCLDTFGVSDMAEVINAGEDPHIHLAVTFPDLQHMTYEEANALKKKDMLVKRMRQLAKPGNFGRMGGMSAATMQVSAAGMGVVMSLEEAQMVIDAFDTRWRESNLSSRWVSARTRDGGMMFTQPRSLRRRGNCRYTQAKNQPFQGGTADLADDVLRCLLLECYTGRLWDAPDSGRMSPLYGARPWNFSHDEFILEFHVDRYGYKALHRAGERLEQIVVERGRHWFPDVVTRTESAAARRWRKDRKSGDEFKRTLKDGYLCPMEDVGQ